MQRVACQSFTDLTYLSSFKLNDAGVFWLRQGAVRSCCWRGLHYRLLFILFLELFSSFFNCSPYVTEVISTPLGEIYFCDKAKRLATLSLAEAPGWCWDSAEVMFWQYLVWYDNCRAATDAHNWQSCLSGEEVQNLGHFCHLRTKQTESGFAYRRFTAYSFNKLIVQHSFWTGCRTRQTTI